MIGIAMSCTYIFIDYIADIDDLLYTNIILV